jgi:hypothetical protein
MAASWPEFGGFDLMCDDTARTVSPGGMLEPAAQPDDDLCDLSERPLTSLMRDASGHAVLRPENRSQPRRVDS